jgi:hypothetical protein
MYRKIYLLPTTKKGKAKHYISLTQRLQNRRALRPPIYHNRPTHLLELQNLHFLIYRAVATLVANRVWIYPQIDAE